MSIKGVLGVVFVSVLAYEVIREVVVLKHLGFQPDRFFEWLRG